MEKELKEKVIFNLIKEWKNNNEVKFYGGRTMLYSAMHTLGFDAEKLYNINRESLKELSSRQIMDKLI